MTAESFFDADLLRRYDQPGPRYTSYPAAPQFENTFGETAFREHARRSNEELIPRRLSLYVHVPYCFSPCFYCGCNRVITRDPAKGERYVERLLREIQRVAPLFDRDRDVMQLHFGGGTPNFLHPSQLDRLLESLGRHFHFRSSPGRDFSIELRTCIDDGLQRLSETRHCLLRQPDISHVGDSFSQNERALPAWERAVDEDRLPVWRGIELTLDDVVRGDVIQQLMCRGEIDIAATERRYDLDFASYFQDCRTRLNRLADDGLVTLGEARIAATSRGRYLLRIIAMCFDRYLPMSHSPDGRPRYSKAI